MSRDEYLVIFAEEVLKEAYQPELPHWMKAVLWLVN
jgi:hypothetical protein